MLIIKDENQIPAVSGVTTDEAPKRSTQFTKCGELAVCLSAYPLRS